MRRLTQRHLLISLCSSDPGLFAPHYQWSGNEENYKAKNSRQNVKVLYAHALNPRSKGKEDDDGEEVAGEDDTNQGITDDLRKTILLVHSLEQVGYSFHTYVLITVHDVSKRDVSGNDKAEAENTEADGKQCPMYALQDQLVTDVIRR